MMGLHTQENRMHAAPQVSILYQETFLAIQKYKTIKIRKRFQPHGLYIYTSVAVSYVKTKTVDFMSCSKNYQLS